MRAIRCGAVLLAFVSLISSRAEAAIWYVNDASTVGDVYTTAVGASGNNGISPATPKRFLNEVVGLLSPGDTVYVDAGTYLETQSVAISDSYVWIIGKDSASTVIDFNDTSVASARAFSTGNVKGITIRDLRVTRSCFGIQWSNVDSSVIERVRIDTSGFTGIYFQGGNNWNHVSACVIANATTNIWLVTGSDTNTFVGNTSSSGAVGFRIETSYDNVFDSNVASYSTSHGIWLNGASGNVFRANRSHNNTMYGISLSSGSMNNVISGNTSTNNSGYGIYLGSPSGGNTFSSNLVAGNGQGGIFLASSHLNVLNANTIFNNMGSGLGISAARNNAIFQNVIDSNSAWAVSISGVSYADTFRMNTLRGSAGAPDSVVSNGTTYSFDFARNWWGAVDSSAIRAMIWGTSPEKIIYIPYRLGASDTAPGADTVAPRAPDTVSASLFGGGTRITWAPSTASEEPSSFGLGLAGYRVYRTLTGETANWTRIANLGLTLIYDDGVTDSRYIYRVTAYDNHAPLENESYFSDSVGNITYADTMPPPVPPLLDPPPMAETTAREVVFSWAAVADAMSGLAGYRFQMISAGAPEYFADSWTTATSAMIAFTAPDTFQWRAIAFDQMGNVDSTAAWRTFVCRRNWTPAFIQALSDTVIFPGGSLSFTAAATDTDGDSLTYVLDTGPVGLLLNSATGAITWTPTLWGSTNRVGVSVTDMMDTATETFTVVVAVQQPLAPDTDKILAFAGTGTAGFGGDGGAADSARLNSPQGIFVTPNGDVYICDAYNHRVRKVDRATGIITTIAGTGAAGFSGDSGLATNAKLNRPSDLVVASNGDIFIADRNNYRVRKIDGVTRVISTFAGTGSASYNGDSILAVTASLYSPTAVALDAAGNLYVSDASHHRIRKIDAAGVITTVVGTGASGYNGDNIAATSAQINFPMMIVAVPGGGFQFSDNGNGRVRRVSVTGIITTVAGNGIWGSTGDGGTATSASLSDPTGMDISPDGSFIFADDENFKIRRVDTAGIITTVTGTGADGGWVVNGNGGSPLATNLNYPMGVHFDPLASAFFIAEQDVVRHVFIPSIFSGPCVDTTPPSVSALLAPADGVETRFSNVSFSWSAVADSDLAGYRLQITRSTDSPTLNVNRFTTNNTAIASLASADTYYWRVVSIDNAGNQNIANQWRILVRKQNAVPAFATIADTHLYPGNILSVSIGASDSEGDLLTYRIDSGPVSISNAGEIMWTPTDTQLGLHQVIVSVSDGIDTATDTFLVVVNDIPALEFSSWKDTIIIAGQSLSVTAQLRDTFTPMRRFSVFGAPSGLVIDSYTGVITWPAGLGSGGVYAFQVRGGDGYDTAVDTFRVTVRDVHETNSRVAGGEVVRPCCGNSLTVTVKLRDQFDGPMSGFRVSLASDRPGVDTLTALNDYTDSYGRALFIFVSSSSGTSVITATVDSTGRSLSEPHVIVVRPTIDWYVSPGGSDAANGRTPSTPFRTIEHAVDTAGQGDVIHLMAGVYTEAPVDIRKSGLTLIGDNVDSVILQPGSNSVGVIVTGVSDVRVLNMTLQTSSLGVKVMNSSNIMIRGNKILDNSSAGVWVHGCRAVSVLNNWIDNPGPARNSTGIYFRASSDNCVVSNTVKNHRLGGIILVEEENSHITSNEIFLDNVPGVGTPPFNKGSLIVYGNTNVISNNNMFNQSNNRSQLYVARQAVVSDNFEIYGEPPRVIQEHGYSPASNTSGTAYCDVNGDGVTDDGRLMRIVGYFGSLDPFAANPTGNLPPVVRNITCNGETEGTSVVFDTSSYVIGWSYSDSDGHPQVNVEVMIATDSRFTNLKYRTGRYQSAETIAIDMKPKGEFFVRLRVDDGRQWSESVTVRFVANDTPGTPQGVAAAGGGFSILVGWRPNPEDIGGYRVYRAMTSGGAYSLVATVERADSLQYLDRLVPAGETRYYVVTAHDTQSPPRESPYSDEVAATATNLISGLTIDGKFTGWSEHGVDEWAQVGAAVTPGRLSKVYVYSDSEFFFIGVDFLMTNFIDRIKDDPVLWPWYQTNKSNIFNYFEFRDENRISLSDPNVIPGVVMGWRYYNFRDPGDGTLYIMKYRDAAHAGVIRTHVKMDIDPASLDWFYDKSSYIRVFGDGRFELSSKLSGSNAFGATTECTSPNDSSLHRVYEIMVPLEIIRSGSGQIGAQFNRFNVGISDWDYPAILAYLAQPAQGQAVGMSARGASDRATAFSAAVERLEAMDDKTRMSLASSLAVARAQAQADPDLNSLLPVGYYWYDGPMQVSPAGTVVGDPALWVSETTPIEASFHLNTPPVAHVPSETVIISPGAEVILDGTLSRDSEMPELRYLWTQVAGAALPISDRYAAQPVVTVPSTGTDSEYRFELTVSDRIYNSASVPLVLTTIQGNNRPSAQVASRTAFGAVGETITLYGQGSDPNGDALAYTWTQSVGDTFRAQNVGDSVFRFVPTRPGRHVFRLSVADTASLRAYETVVVFVAETIPVLSAAANNVLSSRTLSAETEAAIFHLTGTSNLAARAPLPDGLDTAEIGVLVKLAAGFNNSRLVIARTDSSSVRRGLDDALHFDSFSRYLVELHLLSETGAAIGSQTGAFEQLELRYEPRKASVDASLLSRLRVFTYDEAATKWTEVTGFIMEDAGDRVRLRVPLQHLSFYTLAVAVAAPTNLGSFVVYPNPFRPNDGNANTGVEYQPGVVNTGITFENVPANSNIRIYTVDGELVAQCPVGASGGVQWDVRNGRGARVASGVYVYIVTAPNGERRVGKVAVVR